KRYFNNTIQVYLRMEFSTAAGSTAHPYTLWFADGSRILFNSDGTIYQRIFDVSGQNYLTFNYVGGKLSTIAGPSSPFDTMTLFYSGNALASIRADNNGKIVSFSQWYPAGCFDAFSMTDFLGRVSKFYFCHPV